MRYFPQSLESDVAAVLFLRAQERLRSPRVQEAQMGALIIKMLLQKKYVSWGDMGWRNGDKVCW